MKSFEMNKIDTNLICDVCSGTGSHLRMVNGKRKFLDCICFGGCLY